jgi:acetyltransferase-like isoleucine patch superfamily enzyme
MSDVATPIRTATAAPQVRRGSRLEELWWKLRWSSRATAFFHFCAMYAPLNSLRLFFYRRRGIRIGKGVYIVQGCFLEESRPWLITIEEGVRIGAGVVIATHDAVYHGWDLTIPIRYGEVVLKKDCVVGPAAVILPGVTVGERALVAAGAVVVKDVPADTIVAGPTARHLMQVEEGLSQARSRIPEYEETDLATKYPWRLRAHPDHK